MKRSFFLGSLMAASMLSFAQNNAPSIQGLIQKTDPGMNLGMIVVDLNTGATIFEKQGKRVFSPASNMKLFSEAVALLALGPEYQIPTSLSTDAKTLTQGRLNGSLYFHLPADPSLNHQAIFQMMEQLKKWGVTEITGDVVIQSDLAQVPAYPPGMVAKDAQYSYGAPIGPMILDENRLTVTTNPASQAGQTAVVETSSPSGVFQLDNHVETRASAKGCGVSVTLDEQAVLHVRGCVGVGQMAIMQRVPVKHPFANMKAHVLYQLNQLGVHLNGQVRMGAMPANTLMMSKHLSPPIKQLMAATLKPSDNLYANALYLLASNQIAKRNTSWSDAQTITRTFLQQQTGIDFSDAVFADGSGLSRLNRVTPYQTISLLTYLYHKFPLAFEYISALPISGQDGTLQRRLNQPYQKGLIRAKTGTMIGILSLSGYLITQNNHTLAFTIYINTLPGTKPAVSGRYRGFIDAACTSLLLSSPGNGFHLFSFSGKKPLSYQRPPNGVEADRLQQGYWRNLELGFKRELNAKPVTVIFHPQELVIIDKGNNDDAIWRAVKKLKAQRRFSVMVESTQAPNLGSDSLGFLWVQKQPEMSVARRWVIRPAGV
jgi:D-alanyl-D-alanine carboxypeptidase/D-alanyl-D-alanine-endopeptidase (penicillin-binding protein 4)